MVCVIYVSHSRSPRPITHRVLLKQRLDRSSRCPTDGGPPLSLLFPRRSNCALDSKRIASLVRLVKLAMEEREKKKRMRAAATFETKTCQTKSCQKERVPNGGVNTRRWRKNSSVATSCLRFRIEKASRAKKNSFPRRGSITCTSTIRRRGPTLPFRESIQPRSIVRRVFRETFSTRASSLYLSLYLLPYRPRIVARSAAIIIIPFPFDLDLDGRETVSSGKRVGSTRKRTRVANW